MPFYDFIDDTMDKSSDTLHETSLRKPEDSPNVVHLTHLTIFESIYRIRLGSASLTSRPQTSVWYLWAMWPVTFILFVLTNWLYCPTFVVERNTFNNIASQIWVLPKFKFQYYVKWQNAAVNNAIEEAILEAEERGAKLLSLGLLNQGEELNRYGEIYIEKHPHLKIKIVDGSSLAAAVVLNTIPKGTTQVLLRGHLSKVARAVASSLFHRGIQVNVLHKDEHDTLRHQCETNIHLAFTINYDQKIWLIGDGLTELEQLMAPKGTLFIPFNQFPPKRIRKDCVYHSTPALIVPTSLQNLDSCEDWLPRRVLSAWRVAGIVHALEKWQVHECGDTLFDIDKVWQASLQHGFRPLSISAS